jgi:nucleoside diphosphate kinase
MCEFKSMIITKGKNVLYLYESDHHEDIIDKYKKEYNLFDNTSDHKKMTFARVEIKPSNGDVFEKDLSKWEFSVDQSIEPSWFSEVYKTKCLDELEKYLNKVIIDGQDLEKIVDEKGLYIRNSKINSLNNSQVNKMYDNSQVNEMWGNSRVNEMYGNSRVNEMYDNSRVNEMYDNSQVNEMWGNSRVNEMYGNSRVNEMYDNSLRVDYRKGCKNIYCSKNSDMELIRI